MDRHLPILHRQFTHAVPCLIDMEHGAVRCESRLIDAVGNSGRVTQFFFALSSMPSIAAAVWD
ncbi:MAG: hypothetical protein IJT34_11280, partial [Butyrivibrio sp.]|nr:hypothetical protein [Butyrivibrio sp.]